MRRFGRPAAVHAEADSTAARTMRCWPRRAGTLIAAALLCAGTMQPAAAVEFDPKGWLAGADVRVLVLTVTSGNGTAAADRAQWARLGAELGPRGLRRAVVRTGGASTAAGGQKVNADYLVEDASGTLLGRFSVRPGSARHLAWSWRGRLLADVTEPRALIQTVRAWFKSAPRVVVDAPTAALRKELEAGLVGRGKLVVVLDEKERQQIRRLQRESKRLTRTQGQAVKAGEELSANLRLDGSLRVIDGTSRLYLSLEEVRTGRVVASASAPWRPKRARPAAREAVGKLLAALTGAMQQPQATGSAGKGGALAGPRFRFSSDGRTFSDSDTGLTWQARPGLQALGWKAAKAACGRFNPDGKAGWRLPNQLELESLLDTQGGRKQIARRLAPSTPKGWYWTGTPQTDGSKTAWTVFFPNGYPGTSTLTSARRVRCVR